MAASEQTEHGNQPASPVRRRRVFYIPGYDPIHPRRYRELYRREGARQAAISGYDIGLRPGGGQGRYGWEVAARIEDSAVATSFEVMVWSDLVRQSMSQGIAATYGQLLRTAWAYIGSGALFRLMRLRKGPMIAALYPIVMLAAQALVALLLAAAVAWVLSPWLPWWLATAGGLGPAVLCLRWFRARDNRLYAYYLMHDYAYSAQAGGANPPELEIRMRAFADRIGAALADETLDEVLVVGHSSGAHLAISILADLIRQGAMEGTVPRPALGFLALGQVVPMVSFLPGAARLRADLHYLAARTELTWVDVTAPGDGCAFALCDPVAVTGVAPPEKRWPLVISAAFTQTLSPERWRALRWRFFRLHFQYLCAFDRPGDYDYFRITAGPQSLGARFAGRAPSKSRIERPASGYRSMAA